MAGEFPLVVDKNLSFPYFASGHYHFLIYSLDGSISGVNPGMFIPPIQYLEELYFFIKKGNELFKIHDYVTRAEIYEHKTVHYFSIPQLKLDFSMTYFVPDDVPGIVITIMCSKTMQSKMSDELKLLIKPKIVFNYLFHENPNKSYQIWERKGMIKAKSCFDKNLRLAFKATQPLHLESKNNIVTKLKSMKLFVTESLTTKSSLREDLLKLVKEEKKRHKKKYRRVNNYLYDLSRVKINDKELESSFYFAKYSIRQLRHHKPYLGEGFFAGIPYFPEFFSRDTFWSVPGILMTGDFENIKYSLNVFTRYQAKYDTETKAKGKIPHEIWLMGEPNYYTSDSTLLYLYALYHYYIWTGDRSFIKAISKNIILAYEYIKSQMKYYYIINDKLGFLSGTTWMDSYNRKEVAVEMQGLLVKVLEYFSVFAKIFKRSDLIEESLELKEHAKKALESFWLGNYYADRRKKSKKFDNAVTVNPFFLVYLGLVPKENLSLMIETARTKKLISKMGLRSRAKKSTGYIPGSYHKGSIWPFTTALAAIGALKYREVDFATELIEPFKSYFLRYVPSFIPECVNGNSFTINIKGSKAFSKDDSNQDLHFNCYLQLWSAATYVQLVVEGILGIIPSPPRTVNINPCLPEGITEISIKNLRVLKGKINVTVKRDEFGGLIVNSEILEGNLIIKSDVQDAIKKVQNEQLKENISDNKKALFDDKLASIGKDEK